MYFSKDMWLYLIGGFQTARHTALHKRFGVFIAMIVVGMLFIIFLAQISEELRALVIIVVALIVLYLLVNIHFWWRFVKNFFDSMDERQNRLPAPLLFDKRQYLIDRIENMTTGGLYHLGLDPADERRSVRVYRSSDVCAGKPYIVAFKSRLYDGEECNMRPMMRVLMEYYFIHPNQQEIVKKAWKVRQSSEQSGKFDDQSACITDNCVVATEKELDYIEQALLWRNYISH